MLLYEQNSCKNCMYIQKFYIGQTEYQCIEITT